MGILEENSVPAATPPQDGRAYYFTPDGGAAADGTPTGTYQPIPAAYRYVLAEDTFLGGWGASAVRHNYIVVPCADEAEVAIARQRILERPEMGPVLLTFEVAPAPDILYSLLPDWNQPR